MEHKKPFILISNDDGYQSLGIRTLVEALAPMARLLVCAPDGGRSGFSRAFSADKPLTLKPVHVFPDVEAWASNGTPVDCVKLAISELCHGELPDLVIGGINHGDNSTVNAHYSGTMGVAMEGCMKYIPSLAFSSCYYDPTANLKPTQPHIVRIVQQVLEHGLPRGICLNVNFPARQTFEGTRICRMAYGRWVQEVVKEQHPRGYPYYWMVGHYQNDEPQAQETDQWALQNGFVAITPTQLDVTAYAMMDTLNRWDL